MDNTFFIYGTDGRLRQDALLKIEKKYASYIEDGNRFVLERPSLEEIIFTCEQIPLFGDGVLVIAKDPVFMDERRASSDDKDTKDDSPKENAEADDGNDQEEAAKKPSGSLKDFSEWLPTLPKESALIIILRRDTESKRLLSLFADKYKINCGTDKLTPENAKAWLSGYVNGKYKIGAAAMDLLLENIGPNPEVLANELEKLFAYADFKEITTAHINEMGYTSPEKDAFNMINLLLSGKTKEGINAINDLLTDSQKDLGVLRVMIWKVRQLSQLSGLLESKTPDRFIEEELRLYGNNYYTAKEQALKRPLSAWINLFTEFNEYEYKMKQGKIGITQSVISCALMLADTNL